MALWEAMKVDVQNINSKVNKTFTDLFDFHIFSVGCNFVSAVVFVQLYSEGRRDSAVHRR